MKDIKKSTSCLSSFNNSLGVVSEQNRIFRGAALESITRLSSQYSTVQRIGDLVRGSADISSSALVRDSSLVSIGQTFSAMNFDSFFRLSRSSTFQGSLIKCVQDFNAESVIKVGALSSLFESFNEPLSRNLLGHVVPNNFSYLVGSALSAQSMKQFEKPIGSVFEALSRTSFYDSSAISVEFGGALEEIPESSYTSVAKLLGEIDQDFLLQVRGESLDSQDVAEEIASFVSAVAEGNEVGSSSISLAAKKVLILFAQVMLSLLCAAIYDANKTDFSYYWEHLRITNYIDIKKGIKNAPESIDYALLEDYRIISGKGVRVRETPKRNKIILFIF